MNAFFALATKRACSVHRRAEASMSTLKLLRGTELPRHHCRAHQTSKSGLHAEKRQGIDVRNEPEYCDEHESDAPANITDSTSVSRSRREQRCSIHKQDRRDFRTLQMARSVAMAHKKNA